MTRLPLRSFLGKRLFLLVLTLIVALFSQASGLGSGLTVSDTMQLTDECSECPMERDGQSCPPSCPQCHCGHAGMAVPPAATSARVASAGSVPVQWALARASALPSPLLAGPFRPPSAAVAV